MISTDGPRGTSKYTFSDVTFCLFANVILFFYIGVFQLTNGYGPGGFLSAGAIALAVVYLLLWMMRRTSRRVADRWIMVISGLSVLGDLIVVGWLNAGIFSGDSAILDIVGVLLFYSTYKEYWIPT